MARRCSVVGCDNEYGSNGLCQMHLMRQIRYGNPERETYSKSKLLVKKEPLTDSQRFMKYVQKENDCWIWIGGQANGYGKFRYLGKGMVASRASYMLFNGEIPEGHFVCHTCDDPLCVNPAHLFTGSCQDNVNDKMNKGRHVILRGESHPHAKINEKDVIDIRNSVKTINSIASKYNISISMVKMIRNGKRWGHVQGGKIVEKKENQLGANHPQSKLTEELVRYIRASEKNYKELAQELGFNQMTIYDALMYKTWKHVI